MGLFDLFKTKNTGLTEEQRKWNKMWELWVGGRTGRFPLCGIDDLPK